jgi:hypothetical protein
MEYTNDGLNDYELYLTWKHNYKLID